MIIANSTIANNNGNISFGMIDNSNVIIANSVVWNNGSSEFTNLPNNSILNVDSFYSNINLGDNIQMENSISSEPMFIDYTNNNFNLTSNSPCVDTGTNSLIIDDNIIIDSTSEYYGLMPDMGTNELNTALGDLNQDNIFNIQDIIFMVNLVLDNHYTYFADLNQDSVVNVVDIIRLINIILNL